MRPTIILITIALTGCYSLSNAQTLLQIEGKARIENLEKDNSADSVIVKLPDGNLGVRDVSSLTEFQILSQSNDTLFLSNGGFVKLMDADSTNEIQDLLLNNDTISLTKSPGIFQITQLGCLSGFWVLAHGRICMQSSLQTAAMFYQAVDVCKSIAPGCRVCTYNDFQQACAISLNPTGNLSAGWLGDLGGADDQIFSWNTSSCGGNLTGPPQSAMTVLQYRCCY